MKPIFLVLCIAMLAAVFAGCIVHSHRRGPVVRERRACPPAHHWENGYCVHNGHGHGKHRGKHR
jgi:hypothetical protein